MSTFQVYNPRNQHVVLETDDWVLAEHEAVEANRYPRNELLYIRGTHPTHEWGPPLPDQGTRDRRCRKCGAWDNGSYGSHGPCGYDWAEALVTVLERELAARTDPEQAGN